MLTEGAARVLLVLHTALAVSAVGAATHLALWLRRMRQGELGRYRAVRRFAWIALVLHGLAFVAGNVMYPTYRVEVRAAYLEDPPAVAIDAQARAVELDKVMAREGERGPDATAAITDAPKASAQVARWFDIKEHWVALGLFGSAALALMLSLWDPKRDGVTLLPVAFGLATIVAATLWLGAVIGVLVASWRAV